MLSGPSITITTPSVTTPFPCVPHSVPSTITVSSRTHDVNVTRAVPTAPNNGSMLNSGANGVLVGVGLDVRVSVFAVLVAVGAAVLFGL